MTSVPLRRKLTGEREAQLDLEPFRILRDALGFISLRERPQVILVTSAVSGEGKTSVAGGLARAMAAAGKSVALIEGDVHRPALKRQLGITSNGRGLMNALVDGRQRASTWSRSTRRSRRSTSSRAARSRRTPPSCCACRR